MSNQKNYDFLRKKREHQDNNIQLNDDRKKHHNSENRPRQIVQQPRLPIEDKKDEILATIQNNQITIISGSTGCGKTTMVPVYLYERYGNLKEFKLLVTQPRRIATKSIARRLSQLMNSHLGGLVGYKIGRTDETSSETRIIIATTGLFYNIIIHQEDLAEYSHIILDEVHEREIDIDIVLIMMQYVLHRNNKIKLILMSATIQIELFAKYFSKSLMANFLKHDHYANVRNLSERDIMSSCVEALPHKIFENQVDSNDKAPTVEIKGSPFNNKIFYIEHVIDNIKKEHERNRTHFPHRFTESQFNYYDKQSAALDENTLQIVSYIIKAITLKCIVQANEKLTTILVFLPGVQEIEKQRQYIEKLTDLEGKLEIIHLHSNVNE
jgi:HrpA-like RNA helicase